MKISENQWGSPDPEPAKRSWCLDCNLFDLSRPGEQAASPSVAVGTVKFSPLAGDFPLSGPPTRQYDDFDGCETLTCWQHYFTAKKTCD